MASTSRYQLEMDDYAANEIDNRLPYRKGWPKPLQALPLHSEIVTDQEVRDLLPSPDQINGLLEHHGVKYQFCLAGNRFNKGQTPDPEDITLVINCKGLENLSVAALAEIHGSFQEWGWRYGVELIDLDQANAPLCCIPPDDPFVQEWAETHKQQVMRMICDTKWQTVDVFRCGTTAENRERTVTVLISAWDATSDVWWEHIIPSIRAECGLEVRLLQASSLEATGAQNTAIKLGIEAFTGPLKVGSSIGPLGDGGTGTLGGFVELALSDGKVERFGLSNHHVVKGDRLTQATELHGYFPPNHPLASGSSLPLASPTDCDHDTCLASIRNTIAQLQVLVDGNPERGQIGLRAKVELGETSKAEALRQNLTTIDRLRSNAAQIRTADREGGSVMATSGYRTVDMGGHRWCMDWALVRLPTDRNKDLLLKTHDEFWLELDHWSPKPLMVGNRVFKQGRSTGYTEGIVNSIETTINIPISDGQQHYSSRQGSAWAIIDRSGEGISMTGRPFSAPGDAGSLILDTNRRVIGLLFAIQNCITYFIPFEAVVKDVEFVTGGRVLTPSEDTAVGENA